MSNCVVLITRLDSFVKMTLKKKAAGKKISEPQDEWKLFNVSTNVSGLMCPGAMELILQQRGTSAHKELQCRLGHDSTEGEGKQRWRQLRMKYHPVPTLRPMFFRSADANYFNVFWR